SVADANIGSIMGIGFPGWTGGVLQYINGYEGGVQGFVARARELAGTYGERFTPPQSLRPPSGDFSRQKALAAAQRLNVAVRRAMATLPSAPVAVTLSVAFTERTRLSARLAARVKRSVTLPLTDAVPVAMTTARLRPSRRAVLASSFSSPRSRQASEQVALT